MRKFALSAALALLLVGAVSVGPADAQLFRRRAWGGGYYGYPAYSGYGYGYGYSPGYSYYYSPGYMPNYYSNYGYYGQPYRWWRRW